MDKTRYTIPRCKCLHKTYKQEIFVDVLQGQGLTGRDHNMDATHHTCSTLIHLAKSGQLVCKKIIYVQAT